MSRKALIAAAAAAAVVASLAVVMAASGENGMGSMGRSGSILRPAFRGFYDGHKDTFLSTDISDKTQAAAMHINYAPGLKHVPMAATEEIYLVEGTAAAGQIPVFSSEPGEGTYNPLWHEVMVTWKSGATPVLLVKDDQINALAKEGELTARPMHVILNCPIVRPTKSALSSSS